MFLVNDAGVVHCPVPVSGRRLTVVIKTLFQLRELVVIGHAVQPVSFGVTNIQDSGDIADLNNVIIIPNRGMNFNHRTGTNPITFASSNLLIN